MGVFYPMRLREGEIARIFLSAGGDLGWMERRGRMVELNRGENRGGGDQEFVSAPSASSAVEKFDSPSPTGVQLWLTLTAIKTAAARRASTSRPAGIIQNS
jgi:hypothetical protein